MPRIKVPTLVASGVLAAAMSFGSLVAGSGVASADNVCVGPVGVGWQGNGTSVNVGCNVGWNGGWNGGAWNGDPGWNQWGNGCDRRCNNQPPPSPPGNWNWDGWNWTPPYPPPYSAPYVNWAWDGWHWCQV